jgi:hypothetical protein
MKKLMFVSTVLLATGAIAGVRVETTTRNVATKNPEGPPQVTLVQDGKIRASRGDQGGMILKGTTIYFLDDKRKSYRQMDKAQMQQMAGQANAAMAQMQEKMKNMTPEQRAMMEKMMGGQIPGGLNAGKPDVYDTKDTGKSDTVEGRKCQIWQITRNGALIEEVCAVPFSSLPGKENLEKSFKEIAEVFADITKGMPNADAAVKARTTVKGYPVRTRGYDASGKLRGTETVLTKWVEESLPASTFDIPAGYKQQEMPKLGM